MHMQPGRQPASAVCQAVRAGRMQGCAAKWGVEVKTLEERIDALEQVVRDLKESEAMRERMADILSRTAVALRGPEPPLTRWSWHDLPERAAAAANHDVAKPVKERKRASRLPQDFYPSDAGLAYAEARRIDIASELSLFMNSHSAKGSTMIDWQAAWRTWCDKAVMFGRAGGRQRAKSFQELAQDVARDKYEEIFGRPHPSRVVCDVVAQQALELKP